MGRFFKPSRPDDKSGPRVLDCDPPIRGVRQLKRRPFSKLPASRLSLPRGCWQVSPASARLAPLRHTLANHLSGPTPAKPLTFAASSSDK